MKVSAYKNYLLTVLLVILAFNYVDRLTLGLVLQNIKGDLHLTDTQLGLLSGIAFALFYSFMGIPIARWADHGNRVAIISLAAALWSTMVALCGTASGFLHLLLLRIGVGVGEAGCIPPAHSLIADYFSRAQRPRAVAIYMLGASLSTVIGYFLAGWLNEFYGWRATFVMVGLPGVALAVLAWFTLREPRVDRQVDTAGSFSSFSPPSVPPTEYGLTAVCAILFSNVTFRHLLLCFAVNSFFAYGIWQWQPAFFIRSYALKTGELGTWFTVIYGIGGMVGTYLGGELASRHAPGNERLQLRAMAVAVIGFGVMSFFTYLSPNKYLAFGLTGLAAAGVNTISGPMFATIQTLVPERMRAMAIATIYLFANLIGMGLGPFAAGALSDAFRGWAGDESLRYALLALCPGYLWGAWHLWRASISVTRDIEVELSDRGVGDGDKGIPMKAPPTNSLSLSKADFEGKL